MLWDASFATWQAFGVRTNSSLMLLSADLTAGTDVIFGFDEARRAAILDFLPQL